MGTVPKTLNILGEDPAAIVGGNDDINVVEVGLLERSEGGPGRR